MAKVMVIFIFRDSIWIYIADSLLAYSSAAAEALSDIVRSSKELEQKFFFACVQVFSTNKKLSWN